MLLILYMDPGWLAQLFGHRLVHWKVMDLIPSQGMYSGGGFDPQSGCIQEATD